MPDLNFEVEDAEAIPYAATPILGFKLRVSNADPQEQIETVALTCQIRLDVTRRRYNETEKKRLSDLFGEPERWSHTLRSMLWTFANLNIRGFSGSILVDLPVSCTYDFNVASVKYFYALESGEIPLSFLFSGTVFYRSKDEGLQVEQISWEKEATYRLPVEVWQRMIDIYYPNSAWIYMHRDSFDRLNTYKLERGITTWEQVVDNLLAQNSELSSDVDVAR